MSMSVGGLMSGLDTNSIIDQLKEIQQRPVMLLQQKEANYQVELSVYGSLQSALSSLKSAMDGLDSEEDLTSFSAVSGDRELFTVSADDTAGLGSYDLTVTQLAQNHKLASTAFAAEEAAGEGTVHLKVGSGDAVDISVSATDTIDDIAQAINDADAGVQAGVIFDGTGYHLTLTADETGAENAINLTVTDTGDSNDTDLNGLSRLVYDAGVTENLAQSQAATDSIITVDGVDIHRTTNTVDDVIEGLTINLQSAPTAPNNKTTLSVARNKSSIISKIEAFASGYNQIVEFFNASQSYNSETNSAGVFLGDSTANSIRNSLYNRVTATISSNGTFEKLTDLGITINDNGKLDVDSSVLNTALDDNFDDAVQFFTKSSSSTDEDGFAVCMLNTLDSMLDSIDGTLKTRTDGIQKSIDDIYDTIERKKMRISAWETRTRAQFQSLELLMGKYQATGDYLNQQVAGLQNLNNFIANR